MSESNQHSELAATVRQFIDHHGYVDLELHGERIPYSEEDSQAMAALDGLVEQYEDLKRQYDGISRESDERGIRMSDLHIENLRLKEQQETLLDLLRVSVGFWIATPQEFIDAQHNVPNRDKVKQIRDLLSNPSTESAVASGADTSGPSGEPGADSVPHSVRKIDYARQILYEAGDPEQMPLHEKNVVELAGWYIDLFEQYQALRDFNAATRAAHETLTSSGAGVGAVSPSGSPAPDPASGERVAAGMPSSTSESSGAKQSPGESSPASDPTPLQRAYGGKVRTVSTDPSNQDRSHEPSA